MPNLCVTIPCYNEHNRFPLKEFEEYIENNNVNFCFVNDGSTDKTLQTLNKLQGRFNDKVLIVNLSTNTGKAEAVRKGINSAFKWKNFEYMAYFDADLAIPLQEIDFLYNFAVKHPQFILFTGTRLKRLGANINRKPVRHILGRIFTTFSSNLFKLPAYDTQCGFKLFHSQIIQQIFSAPFHSKWFFDIEIILRIKKNINNQQSFDKICEVPLWNWKDISGSKLRLKDFILVPFELIKIKRKYKNT